MKNEEEISKFFDFGTRNIPYVLTKKMRSKTCYVRPVIRKL